MKKDVAWGIMVGLLAYVLLAWWTFEWRNPTCNESVFYRHWLAILTFQKLPEYQPLSIPVPIHEVTYLLPAVGPHEPSVLVGRAVPGGVQLEWHPVGKEEDR